MIYAGLLNFDFVAKFTVTNLNKDFIKAVRGGGVTILWKYFIKFRYFLNDGFPKSEGEIKVTRESGMPTSWDKGSHRLPKRMFF